MQVYEYIVVTADNKIQRIIADSIKGVLDAVDENESAIINIFRNHDITEGGTYGDAIVTTEVYPPAAAATGCRAYPTFPVKTKKGESAVLCASVPAGWKLDGWYCNDKLVGTDEQLTVIVEDEGDVLYTARFTPSV